MLNKKLLFAFLLITLSISLQNFSSAQTAFEGKVKFQISENGNKHVMDYFVKGSKFRIDAKEMDEAGTMIFDSKAKKMLIIMPQQKMYMEMPLDLSGEDSYFDDESYKGKISRTGDKKVINGYECEKWIVEDGKTKAESWVTNELGGFMFFGNPMDGGSDWKSKLSGENFFPMLVNVYEGGKLVNTMEVLEIQKQSLDNSMFSAPAGFQKFEMPSMSR